LRIPFSGRWRPLSYRLSVVWGESQNRDRDDHTSLPYASGTVVIGFIQSAWNDSGF